jgi:secreted trypsin-like serine protease
MAGIAGALVAGVCLGAAGQGRAGEVGHPVRGVVAIMAASAPIDDIFNGQLCGGVLIKPDVVLTAAHCVAGRAAARIRVVVGADNLCRDRPIDGVRTQAVEVTPHPDHDHDAGGFDLATLRLTESMPGAWTRMRAELTSGVADAAALGWGRASPGGVPPCRLMKRPMKILDAADCAARLAIDSARVGSDRAFDPDAMLCAVPAEPGEQGVCTGDSGGPLIVGDDLATGSVVGIVSWGRGCGADGPGVYARAADWP